MGIHPPRLRPTTEATPPAPAADGVVGTTSRRGFLSRVAVGGAVAAAAPQLLTLAPSAAPVAAQEEGGFSPSADEEHLIFLTGLALAMAGAYASAQEVPGLSDAVVSVLRDYRSHYNVHAATMNSLLTPEVIEPVETANETFAAEVASTLAGAGDQAAALTALAGLEDTVGATYLAGLEVVEEINDAKALATLVPVPGQHSVVLRSLAEPDADPATLLPESVGTDGALTPEAYPAGEGGADAEADAEEGTDTEADAGTDGATESDEG